MNETMAMITAFVAAWPDSPDRNKEGFLTLHQRLAGFPKAELSFHPRPGVTYSLRAAVPGQTRPLFAMIDVIEDQPRWLSVCFYADMIEDPEERSSQVPAGLSGEDARCFDLDACDEEVLAYVAARLEEAYERAVNGFPG